MTPTSHVPLPRVRRLFARCTLLLGGVHALWRGYAKGRNAHWPVAAGPKDSPDASNPLHAFFEAHKEGRGIWKWNHYFEIYDRHFSRFRGRDVHVLEIGVYSGGSLEMWRDYFGPRCQIYGVDIEPACRTYEDDSIKVFIGDQADRGFWRRFKQEVQTVDIVIDDGDHVPEHQIVALEELLPYLHPGGIYVCEDVDGVFTKFISYVYGLASNLNMSQNWESNPDNDERQLVCKATQFQSAVRSIHLYPYVVVLERTDAPISGLVAPKRGTQWEPFFK